MVDLHIRPTQLRMLAEHLQRVHPQPRLQANIFLGPPFRLHLTKELSQIEGEFPLDLINHPVSLYKMLERLFYERKPFNCDCGNFAYSMRMQEASER